MKKPVFKAVMDYDNKPLASCLEAIAAQQALLNIVKTALPAALAEHALHCVAAGSLLLVYSDSASWASQIRFFNKAILDKLQAAGRQQFIRLQIRLVPQLDGQAKPKRPARLPSADNVRMVCDSAWRGDEQDVLGAALARLGATLSRRLRDN